MKKLSFLLIILSLTVIFSACPPLLEDDEADDVISGDIVELSFDDTLDCYKWFEILDQIAKEGKFVSLDLSKCTCKDDNPNGGLIKDPSDPLNPDSTVFFDPFPASASGKDLIVSIILPEIAKDIKVKTEDDDFFTDINDEKIEAAKKYSAFRSFTHLRSVKANNVTHIGNFAFADCKELTEVNFPRVSSPPVIPPSTIADIDKYAFLGCTGLKEIKFNSATIIGECAFKDCTGLSKIDFPEVKKIGNNAFEGCTGLVNVFFEKADEIFDEAFKGCTSLKKAEFNVTLAADGSGTEPNIPDPLDESHFADIVDTSVIFHPSVFNGCKALEVLNIRNAWNVYFAKNVFANTGTAIEIYLLDVLDNDHNGGFGHPQSALFLGKDVTVTIKTVNIFVPINNGKIQGNFTTDNHYDSIAKFIRSNDNYKNIDVNVNKR